MNYKKDLFGNDVPPDYDAKVSDFWQTPPDIYKRFMFDETCFDPCPANPTFDGLSVPWYGLVFCNPPYSQIPAWIDKAWRESCEGYVESITMLLPNWTDRQWFQEIAMCKIEFLPGRLKFLDPKTGKPTKVNPRFGSMLVHIK